MEKKTEGVAFGGLKHPKLEPKPTTKSRKEVEKDLKRLKKKYKV